MTRHAVDELAGWHHEACEEATETIVFPSFEPQPCQMASWPAAGTDDLNHDELYRAVVTEPDRRPPATTAPHRSFAGKQPTTTQPVHTPASSRTSFLAFGRSPPAKMFGLPLRDPWSKKRLAVEVRALNSKRLNKATRRQRIGFEGRNKEEACHDLSLHPVIVAVKSCGLFLAAVPFIVPTRPPIVAILCYCSSTPPPPIFFHCHT